jgi:hypothetical protein
MRDTMRFRPREDEDFFSAGGDPLGAVRLIGLMAPTPAGLSRLLEEAVEEATQRR